MNALSMFRASVARDADATALWYFGNTLSFGDIDRLSDEFAGALSTLGFKRNDRIALYMQNVPQFAIALLAAWKLQGAAVLVNPMNTSREAGYIIRDSGASVVLCLEALHDNAAAALASLDNSDIHLITTPGDLFAGSRDTVIEVEGTAAALDFANLCGTSRGFAPPPHTPSPDDLAFITYTSGTTGEPKGAMNTHGNVSASTLTYRDWMGLSNNDSILAVAPVFHITGIIAHITLGFLLGAPVTLFYRFNPRVALAALRATRPTFTTGVITAFNALIDHPDAKNEDFASLRVVYSGGAPIAPALLERFHARTGVALHSIYGLTETTSPSHAMPLGSEPRMDQSSGALSVGPPVTGTESWIEDLHGKRLAAFEPGEIVIRGPQVVPGYWNKPEHTAASIPHGALHTGDIGFFDDDGWFYIIDRLKDMISASGYKVWPREVEDVLCAHPDVLEAAVVGVPDEYRGETVWAFVRARAGVELDVAAIDAHCREQLAAYKRPRRVILRDALPTTASGKLLRRELRTVAETILRLDDNNELPS
jgi:long-chain acyl-CoA synthetase